MAEKARTFPSGRGQTGGSAIGPRADGDTPNRRFGQLPKYNQAAQGDRSSDSDVTASRLMQTVYNDDDKEWFDRLFKMQAKDFLKPRKSGAQMLSKSLTDDDGNPITGEGMEDFTQEGLELLEAFIREARAPMGGRRKVMITSGPKRGKKGSVVKEKGLTLEVQWDDGTTSSISALFVADVKSGSDKPPQTEARKRKKKLVDEDEDEEKGPKKQEFAAMAGGAVQGYTLPLGMKPKGRRKDPASVSGRAFGNAKKVKAPKTIRTF